MYTVVTPKAVSVIIILAHSCSVKCTQLIFPINYNLLCLGIKSHATIIMIVSFIGVCINTCQSKSEFAVTIDVLQTYVMRIFTHLTHESYSDSTIAVRSNLVRMEIVCRTTIVVECHRLVPHRLKVSIITLHLGTIRTTSYKKEICPNTRSHLPTKLLKIIPSRHAIERIAHGKRTHSSFFNSCRLLTNKFCRTLRTCTRIWHCTLYFRKLEIYVIANYVHISERSFLELRISYTVKSPKEITFLVNLIYCRLERKIAAKRGIEFFRTAVCHSNYRASVAGNGKSVIRPPCGCIVIIYKYARVCKDLIAIGIKQLEVCTYPVLAILVKAPYLETDPRLAVSSSFKLWRRTIIVAFT